MRFAWKRLSVAVYLCWAAFLQNSCSPGQEKTAPTVHTVEIKQMQFMPGELTVEKGDTVIWINRDIVAHDVTEESKKEWTSSTLQSGESWSMVATESSNYYCSIHMVMKGRIIVE